MTILTIFLFPPFDDNGGDGADEYLFNYNRRLLYTEVAKVWKGKKCETGVFCLLSMSSAPIAAKGKAPMCWR
jgi:hypothetical protein